MTTKNIYFQKNYSYFSVTLTTKSFELLLKRNLPKLVYNFSKHVISITVYVAFISIGYK